MISFFFTKVEQNRNLLQLNLKSLRIGPISNGGSKQGSCFLFSLFSNFPNFFDLKLTIFSFQILQNCMNFKPSLSSSFLKIKMYIFSKFSPFLLCFIFYFLISHESFAMVCSFKRSNAFTSVGLML